MTRNQENYGAPGRKRAAPDNKGLGDSAVTTAEMLAELARVKAVFQLRAICAVIAPSDGGVV